jgi:hypothetical protein
MLHICKSRFVALHYILWCGSLRELIRGDGKMTQEARRAAIKKLIKEHTARVTVSESSARDSLIKEGFYTKSGKLTARYGGKAKKA